MDINDAVQDLDRSRKIEEKNSRLRRILGPIEDYVIMLQRILVWEQPYIIILLLLAVNLIFWLATTWCLFSLIGVTGMVIVALEMFASYAWPAIEQSELANSSNAEWTEVHPHLMSVPELSRALAGWWQKVDDAHSEVTKMRASNRAKFFVSSVFILSTLAVIGIYVPGFYILYAAVMSLLLWPAICYHAVVKRISEHIKPVGALVERTLNIKRKHQSKRDRDRRRRQGNNTLTADDDTDSDEGIEDFIPSVNTSFTTALARATMNETVGTEEENEADHTLGSQLASQLTSFSHSRDHSDDDLLSDDYLPHFARGLGNEMPSIEGFDTTGSIRQFITGLGDLMPSIDQYDSGKKSRNDVESSLVDYGNLSAELDVELEAELDHTEEDDAAELQKMDFFPSHYRETSPDVGTVKEVEEEALSQGLSFDELSEALETTGSGAVQSNVIGVIGDMLGQSRSTIMSAISSSTVTTLMTSTAVGFSAVRDKVSSTISGAMAAGRAKPSIEIVEEEEGKGNKTGEEVEETGRVEEIVPKAEVKTEDATDLLDAEFEFLDREELDVESV